MTVPLSIINAGKKLIGKPFITDGSQIYCGAQVKSMRNTLHVL